MSRKCENELNLKNCDSINPKRQKIFEKFDENLFEFNSFDSTSTTEIGWSKIIKNWICSKFVRFDNLQFD